jgi:hypothetical protein
MVENETEPVPAPAAPTAPAESPGAQGATEQTPEEKASTEMIDKANEAAERLEAANKKYEENHAKKAAAQVKETLGGKADAGIPAKEETPEQYKDRIMRGDLTGKEKRA